MRKFSFLFLTIIIIAIFFIGFFMYYVPTNRALQNKYAFLVLDNIKSNLQSKIEANVELYRNHLNKAFENGLLNPQILDHEMAGLNALGVQMVSRTYNANNGTKSLIMNFVGKKHMDSVHAQLTDISMDSMFYTVFGTKDSLVVEAPLRSLFEEILQTHKKDFFGSFLFAKIQDDMALPIYLSPELNLGTEISVDSFLPGSKNGFYQGIADVPSEAVSFKMFYIPVNLTGNHFVICGFKNSVEYQESLHEVSSGFIYPIVIVFLLLLIILPLIKLSIMGATERIRIWDFAGYFFSLFVGCIFITLIIIQVILLKDSGIRVHNNLQVISNQIGTSFRDEIKSAVKLLEAIDTVPNMSPRYKKDQPWQKDSTLDITHELIRWLVKSKHKDHLYYNFDRISWTDSTGQQIIKGQIDGQSPIFTEISNRKYFKQFKTGDFYRLPDRDSAEYSMEPVFNWIDGSFRMVIAKPSVCNHAFIVQASVVMYTFSQSITPPGYGYALVAANGEVQVHSDSSHNLNENFFDELEDASPIKSAMKARQALYVPETKFYGKRHALLMTPVNGLPLYLVTFYDNGNIFPVNMRILIFSLLFCFITLAICWLIWMILFWRRFSSKPLLFSYMYYLHWIIPRKQNTQIYLVGFFYLCIYIVALLLVSFMMNRYTPENNHIILIILLQTPINVTCGLFFLSRMLKIYQGKTNFGKRVQDKKANYALIAMAAMFLGCLILYRQLTISVVFYFLAFELALGLFLAYVYFNAEKLSKIKSAWQDRHLTFHTLLVEAIVACLAVLPAGLFTWYAHNQEILQSVKKDQLCLSFSIEDRKNGIYGQLYGLDSSVVRPKYVDTLIYGRGIYRTARQIIRPSNGSINPVMADSGFEKFYFSISDLISSDYYADGLLPALKDTSADRSWEWLRPSGDGWLQFIYTMKPGMSASLLNIRTEMPSRFIFLSDLEKLIGLILFGGVLFFGLFFLIYRISEGIFLNKFVDYAVKQTPGNSLPFFDDYYAARSEQDKQITPDEFRAKLQGAVFEYIPSYNEKEMNAYEIETVSNLQKYKVYYSFVLEKCSPTEKYLLYSFAINGFLNYKNVSEIYHMLDDGILKEEDGEIRVFSIGFRAYMLKYYSEEGQKIVATMQPQRTAWQTFQLPFFILLVAVASFVFFTRQETWQKFSALLAALSTAIPVLIGLFRTGTQKNADAT